MNNMRIAVCDDEKQIVEHIEKLIIRYANSFNMVINTDIFLDGQMLISELSSGVHYDIVILDICMPEKSGIDIGVYIREVMNDNISQIIYISSERQYAMELFKVQPLDFLIKPVEYDNLVNVLNKAVHLLGISNNVLTYEKNSSCLSSIWETDETTQKFLAVHGRAADYKKLAPADLAYYDGVVEVDLSAIRPMIALPMHPSNAFTIEELNANLEDILHACEQDVQKLIGRKDVSLDLCSKIENGKLRVDQGVIAGCAGGLYDSIYEAASILKGHTGGCGDYALSVYPGSQPIMMELVRTGVIHDLMASGATVRTAFCGPCFGAGDVPANGALSIRHTTRNFPSREGSKPGNGQLSGVALMDARSIAATTANGGILTPATDIDYDPTVPEYQYDPSSYDTRVYQGFGKGDYDALLKLGPNIKDWPEIAPLGDNLLLKVASYITDPVTTTDELIPSGETSSYRSNPLGLAEFTLSRKDPEYVGRAKAVQAEEKARRAGEGSAEVLAQLHKVPGCENLTWNDVQIASTIFAVKPGDGSAREQAASCQRVLGAGANIVAEYATKRYRSNLINWGMLPLQLVGATPFGLGDYVFIPNVREALKGDLQDIKAYVLGDTAKEFGLYMAPLTADERKILADGCLINFYKH